MAIVKSPLANVYDAIGIKDPDENDESLQDYAAEAASQFLKEWWDDQTSGDDEQTNVPEDIEYPVRDAVWEAVSGHYFGHHVNAIKDAIERVADQSEDAVKAAGAINGVDYDVKKGNLVIDIAKPFLKIWRAATEGEGYSAWGGDEKLSDIKSARTVINILKDMADVYGFTSMKRIYEDAFDRFEPDTGSYAKLAGVARAAFDAWKKSQ